MQRRALSLLLLFLVLFPAFLRAAELLEGMTRAEVEEILGKPVSVLQRGDRTLLLYPKKGRVEFENGRAVLFTNVQAPEGKAEPLKVEAADSQSAAEPPAVVATPKAAAGTPTTHPAPSATTKPSTATPAPKAAAVAPPKTGPSPAQTRPARDSGDEIAKQQAAFADAVEKLSENPRGAMLERPPPAVGYWTALLVECIVRILVTVVVLKLAFKWADVHADWGQMWLPSLADSLARSLIAALAMKLWHTDQLFHIDDGVSYFVLLFTLMKTTHACTLARAVAVTMAAKLASLVVWVLLSVALLSLLA